MTREDAIDVVKRAGEAVDAERILDEAEARGATVSHVPPGKKFSKADRARIVFANVEAFRTALAERRENAISLVLQAARALPNEALTEAAFALTVEDKGELRRAAAFALAASYEDRALDYLFGAIDKKPGPVPPNALAKSRHPRAGVRLRQVLEEVGVLEFSPRPWPRQDAWAKMAPEERAAFERPDPSPTPEILRASAATAALAQIEGAAFVDLATQLFASHPSRRLRYNAAQALAKIDDPRADRALDARWDDYDSSIVAIAVGRALERDAHATFDRVDKLAAAETPTALVVLQTVLHALHGGTSPRVVDPDRDPLLLEPRLLDLAARLRRHPRVGQAARRVLSVANREHAIAAIERNPIATVRPAPATLPQRRDFLARYEAGDPTAWDDLVAHAAAVTGDEGLRAEASAVAVALMKRVRRNADAIRSTLEQTGAQIANEGRLTNETLARLASVTGAPLPIAFEAFAREVGSLDFGPAAQYDYGGSSLESEGLALLAADPLMILTTDSYVVAQLDQFAGRIAASHPEIVGPFVLDVAPDFLHKQNISGGSPYSFELPASGAVAMLDPPLFDDRQTDSFVSYLRHAFAWGGFPGLDVIALPEERVGLNERLPFQQVRGPWRPAAERALALLKTDLVPF